MDKRTYRRKKEPSLGLLCRFHEGVQRWVYLELDRAPGGGSSLILKERRKGDVRRGDLIG